MKQFQFMAVILAAFFYTSWVANAAAPSISWQGAFGGTQSDVPYQVRIRPGGGVYIGGESGSTNGTKTSPAFGGRDVWVVALDASGNPLWDHSFGGLGEDRLFALEVTSNSRLIIAGSSTSIPSGNKTSAVYGLRDYWVLLLDGDGEKVWEKSFGGYDDDYATCVVETSDGGFLVGGYSRSPDGGTGNKTARLWGLGDTWIVRLDAQGNKLWDRSYGGTGDDGAFSLVRTTDDGFVVASNSDSGVGGNKTTPNYGFYDAWVLKLDAKGDILWDRTFGGDNDDGYYAMPMVATSDGGVVLAADSFSGKTGNKGCGVYGDDDFWVLRLDTDGNRLWETNCGGVFSDYPMSLVMTSGGGIVVGGGSNSTETGGNRTALGFGSTDFWLIELDGNGVPLWDKAYGGASEEAFLSLSLARDTTGALYCLGDSVSGIGGSKTVASLGSYDFWLVKLDASMPPQLRVPAQENISQNGFRLFVQGESGKNYVTEFSLNWSQWTPLSTNQVTSGEVEIVDAGAKTNAARFYRARELP